MTSYLLEKELLVKSLGYKELLSASVGIPALSFIALATNKILKFSVAISLSV